MTGQNENPLEDSSIRSEREKAMLACLDAITKLAKSTPFEGTVDEAEDIEDGEPIYDAHAAEKAEALARTYKILSEAKHWSRK